MANHRAEGAAAVVLVPAGDRDALALQDLFLDAARVLMLFGAVATIGATSAGPVLAFLGLLLWLLGVCLVLAALVPAAGRRFPPHAALLAATAMAIVAILKHSFTLLNYN